MNYIEEQQNKKIDTNICHWFSHYTASW